MMMNQDASDDFVIATGLCHSVKDFLEYSFGLLDLNYNDYVEIDPDLYRPSEVHYLKGDATKAKKILDWQPEISFEDLVKDMVYSDIEANKQTNLI
jgi:GDPmannose 4,6-dehydratase